jgi:hypothetical protein
MSEPESASAANASSPALIERRAWVRYASNMEIACRTVGAPKDFGWPAKVVNISVTGIGMLMRHCFARGSLLEIELCDRAEQHRHTVRVRVVHVTAVRLPDALCWMVGGAFAEPLREEELQVILGMRQSG